MNTNCRYDTERDVAQGFERGLTCGFKARLGQLSRHTYNVSPLSTLGHCFDVCVLSTLPSPASLDSGVNEYLVGQRFIRRNGSPLSFFTCIMALCLECRISIFFNLTARYHSRVFFYIRSNTRRLPDAVLMLARRLPRRPNIKATSSKCLFGGTHMSVNL